MKIAIFSDTFPPCINGVANVAYHSAKGLTDLGNDVLVFTASRCPQECFGKNNQARIFSFPSLSASLIYKNERFTFPLGISLRQLKKFKPDIIHTHTPFGVGWEAVLASKILKVPLVGTHHTFFDHYLRHIKMDYGWMKKISWKATALYYNKCDLVTSPTQSLSGAMRVNGLRKTALVLRNPIDTDLFKPVAGINTKNNLKKRFGIKGQSVVYMGRVSYEKNIDQIIKSFALMVKTNPALKLMIIGDGPEKNNLLKLAGEEKVEKNVIFTGYLFRKDLIEALVSNDIFLTASKSENMPVSVLEVMAVGLPVISVKEKGLAEIIRENVNGFFTKTDNPEDMAQKTLALLSKPELLEKFGKNSRLLALEHSEKKVASLLIETYDRVIKLKKLI
jgi:glycosyltransferase involved in cell wall biosynthesis